MQSFGTSALWAAHTHSLSHTHIHTQMPLNCTRGKRGKGLQNNLIMSFPQPNAADLLSCFCHGVPLSLTSIFSYSDLKYNTQSSVLQIYTMDSSKICCIRSKHLFMYCSFFHFLFVYPFGVLPRPIDNICSL